MLTAVSGRYTNTVTYAFDPAGRKATEGLTISGQTYTIGSSYNARNELVSYTYPDGSVADRAYTARGALSQLKLDTATVDTRTYDDGGRMLTSVLGNGITETRAYRTDNLLTSINSSNTNLGNLAYTWDANKNKTSETITGVMSNYGFAAAGTTYDFEDRLTGFQRAATSAPALLSQSWSLSTVGDWNSVTTNGTAQTRTHGPTHELLAIGGLTGTIDVKGNTKRLPGGFSNYTMDWDCDNRLVGATSSSTKISYEPEIDGHHEVSFRYDALGRRVSRAFNVYENNKDKGEGIELISSEEVVFVQADQQTIADYVGGAPPATPTYHYVYGSYIDEPVVRKGAGTSGTVHYYHRNQQFSIYAITDAAANIVERYAYTAYGQPTILNAAATVIATSAISNRYTYTAREWDATVGLYHFRARWMSGLTGRFLTRDPIKYAGGPSLYLYCKDSPAYRMDALGLDDGMSPLVPGGPIHVSCNTFGWWPFSVTHCQLVGTCKDEWIDSDLGGKVWRTCYPVGRSPNCERKLFNNDGTCPTDCCKATSSEISSCLGEFGYNAGKGCWGDNCQSNTAHRLAKCCLITPWIPGPYGFPSDDGYNPHCLKWKTVTKYACNMGGCFPYTSRECEVSLPDDYYGQTLPCLSGHYEDRMSCNRALCTSYRVFVCDVFDTWTLPNGGGLF